MPMFVTRERVPVTVGENTIYILPKMDLGTRNRLMNEIAKVEKGSGDTVYQLGTYMMMLAEANIVAWEGPAFGDTPCTPANIRRLDPTEPLVDAVLEEIGQRNPQERKAEKNS